MANYTVCSRLLEECGCTERYLVDILAFFLMTGVPLKLCVDTRGQALDLYHQVGLSQPNVGHWLRLLSRLKGKQVLEVIEIPDADYSPPMLFVMICSHTEGDRTLLCASKQHYAGAGWRELIDRLLDKDEAVVHLRATFPAACGTGTIEVTCLDRIKNATVILRSDVRIKGGGET